MTLRRFIGLLVPHAGPLALASVLLLATASIPAAVVALVHHLVTAIGAGRPVGASTGVLIGLVVVHGVARVARTALTKGVAWRLAAELRRKVHAAWLHGRPAGALGDRLSRLGDEIDHVQYGVSALVTAIRNPLVLTGLGVVTVWLAPALAIPALLVVGPILGLGALLGGLVRRRASGQRAARAAWSAVATEQLRALETLQAFGAEAAEAARFDGVTRADERARLALDVARTLPTVVVQALAAGAAGLLLLSSTAGLPGVPPDAAAALVAALALAQRPLAGLAEVWALLQRSLAALERVDDALATAPRIVEPIRPVALPAGPLTLAWEGVELRLGGRTILEAVSVEARPGQILAIVGPTGAGKTSLLRLGWRAIDPTSGAVRLGGVDLREVSAEDRRTLALVPQDLVLWGRTVRENLTLGLPSHAIDDARLVAALRAARADFALADPEGLDAVLAEGARGLSGGERQRLCIARAWARDARVWLLDEPTSHVDAATTAGLAEALRNARHGRTIVVVAHDSGIVAAADRVIRLEGGRVCAPS